VWQSLTIAVKIDPSKERLGEALAQLIMREETIEGLTVALTESQE
jgi:hypothetical protein